MRCTFLMISLLMSSMVYAQTTAPVAADDTFNTPPGAALIVEAAGVLANDTDADGDSLVAILVTEPANGTLAFNRDGSFTYTPNDGFTGADSFTYLAEEVTPETFTVDQTQSGIRFEASLNTALGNDTDDDSSAVSGFLTADVTPNTTPFAEIHITAMDLSLADSLELSFRLGIFGGRLDATTEPDSMQLFVVQPGAPTMIADSSFTQIGNDLGIAGTLNLEASGLIGTVVEDGPQQIEVAALGDLDGFITQRGATLHLALPITFEGTFEVAGSAVDVTVTGFIAATAPVLPPPQTSNTATVSIVVGVNTAAEATADVPAAFALDQNYPNPFNPTTTIGYALPTSSAVSLAVYDVLGRKVATLVNAHQTAGRYTVRFDASSLPGGLYLYRLQADAVTATKTLLVVK